MDTNSPAVAAGGVSRRVPSRWQALGLVARGDLGTLARSWLGRGFLLASAVLTVLAMKGMQAEQQPASQMLEAVYVSYLLVWMHGVIFIAGGALAREQDCLNDAVLSRGLTRGEYLGGKLAARAFGVWLMVAGVLLPVSFWAIRQDQLMRTEIGHMATQARNTRVEAWNPRMLFAGTEGTVVEMDLEVGDLVRAGQVVVLLDDRRLFDELETERRAEQNARNEVINAQRRFEAAKRGVAQAVDALERSEGALMAKDLLSRREQDDLEMNVRARKRDLKDADNQMRIAKDAIETAQRGVENAEARVREFRKRLSDATITAPISGYVTELAIEPGQWVGTGSHLMTLSPLDEFQLEVPVYNFKEFRRLRAGLPAYITIQGEEYSGTIERVGATTKPDRWGQTANFAIVRFQAEGTLGLLGRDADVRLALPPPERESNRLTAVFNAVTGRDEDDLESRTASVTPGWMLVALGKVTGCALLLVSLTVWLLVLTRSALLSILIATGCWHVSNLVFDFMGLRELSYVEIARTMDKVLGGIADAPDEWMALVWLHGIALAFALGALLMFVKRDPPR